jgi:hypothetical protein
LTTAANLGHECVELALWSAADTTLVAVASWAAVIAPGLSHLAIGTVTSHMSSLTTDTADNAGREVLLLWAIVLAMTNFTAVLASLILVVSKGTVQGGELTELVALEFILTFGNGGSLEMISIWESGDRACTYRLDDVVNELLCLVDLLLGVGHDQAV